MFGFNFEYFIVGTAILLLLAIISSKTSHKLGMPLLLSFLFIGMIAGSDGLGKIYFENAKLAQELGILALIFILFSGGLETEKQRIKPIFWEGVSLATLGVMITTILIGLFVWRYFHFSFYNGLLFGAIISSTDSAAVFSILRSRSIGLKDTIRALLEFESGSNDPTAVFLVISCIALIQQTAQTHPALEAGFHFLTQMGIGLVFGILAGKFLVKFINRIHLEHEALYPISTIAFTLLTYGLTSILHGSGFLAVYISGLIVGNSHIVQRRMIKRFHDVTAWFMQIIMFITLGLLVYPSQLPSIALEGIIIALFLILIARPLAVFTSLAFSHLSIKEKILVSWVGLRGATPIILATFPFVAGINGANIIFNIAFFVVISSVLLQGTTIPLTTKMLGITAPLLKREHMPIEMDEHENINNELFEVQVPEGSPIINKKIMDIALPPNTLIVLINKGDDQYITPKGTTTVSIHDRLLIITEKGLKESIQKLIKNY